MRIGIDVGGTKIEGIAISENDMKILIKILDKKNYIKVD